MPLSEGLLEYLAADEFLTRENVLRRHPGLRESLDAPETRRAVAAWLAGDEAWVPEAAGQVEQAIEFLHGASSPEDAPLVKPFLLHGAERVRLRAYEFLLGLYFPDRNPDAVFLLLTGMLSDESDVVRVSGAGYVERASATGELRAFLERWRRMADGRGWAASESYALVGRLLAA